MKVDEDHVNERKKGRKADSELRIHLRIKAEVMMNQPITNIVYFLSIFGV